MSDLTFTEDRYVNLLTQLIEESEKVQNRPPHKVPQESLVGNHVEAALKPYLEENGGPLKMERIEFTPGRNNIIITYPGSSDKYVSFVGSHMDVVPANPEEWSVDPFHLSRDGDKLYGRGTTDCLGHVALITEIFTELAIKKPALKVNVVAVLIANEENSEIPDVGVDALVKHGRINHLKNGWMYWIDSADSNPCVGTGTAITWKLTAKGRKGHSGLPFDAVNPLLMCYEALMVIMEKYHKKYAAHPDEDKYNFMSPSTMKPTMWEQPPGSINQIPGTASISGDIRMTPFYNAEDAMKDVEQWVKELNDDITSLPGRGPKYSYDLGEGKTRGTLSVEWLDEPYHGIACSMESAGFKALHEATAKVRGESKHYSITGSLPLVKELQDEGFDLQISGYGLSSVYHGIDEYCLVSGMKNGFDILTTAMFQLNDTVQ